MVSERSPEGRAWEERWESAGVSARAAQLTEPQCFKQTFRSVSKSSIGASALRSVSAAQTSSVERSRLDIVILRQVVDGRCMSSSSTEICGRELFPQQRPVHSFP